MKNIITLSQAIEGWLLDASARRLSQNTIIDYQGCSGYLTGPQLFTMISRSFCHSIGQLFEFASQSRSGSGQRRAEKHEQAGVFSRSAKHKQVINTALVTFSDDQLSADD